MQQKRVCHEQIDQKPIEKRGQAAVKQHLFPDDEHEGTKPHRRQEDEVVHQEVAGKQHADGQIDQGAQSKKLPVGHLSSPR